MNTKTTERHSYPRGAQPRCAECSHARSFHGGLSHGECKAIGCDCLEWVEPRFSTSEVAEAIGRSETYVKDHAEDLGGCKDSGRWTFPYDTVLYGSPAEASLSPA